MFFHTDGAPLHCVVVQANARHNDCILVAALRFLRRDLRARALMPTQPAQDRRCTANGGRVAALGVGL